MRKIKFYILILLFCGISRALFAQEQLTITTYYPSPYGSYRELTVSDRMAIGDVNQDGRVDVGDMVVNNAGNPIPGSLAVANTLVIEANDPAVTVVPLRITSRWDNKISLQQTTVGNFNNFIEIWNAGAAARSWFFGQEPPGRFHIHREGTTDRAFTINGDCIEMYGVGDPRCGGFTAGQQFEGNIGINTLDPGDWKLAVNSFISHHALRLESISPQGTCISLEAPVDALDFGVWKPAGGKRYGIISSADIAAGNPDAGKFKIQYRGDSLNPVDPPADRLVIDRDGNVGIGTANPAGRLYVQGPDDAATVVAFMPGANTAAPGTPSLNVGIGTTSPERRLDVRGAIHIGGSASAVKEIRFAPYISATESDAIARHIIQVGSDGFNLVSDVVGAVQNFKLWDGNALQTRMTIVGSTGNVGIGTTTPGTYRLYVNGAIGMSAPSGGKTIYDIAEDIPAAGDVEPADVVVIDPKNNQRVIKSSKPYDTAVAGIISTTPGFLIDMKDSDTPLALAGRVLCKVNTENGPIRRGELLVTSSKPGYAMKADIDKLKPGMVLGKALESLEEGEGKIVVLVTLQ